ncbi:hypothetical protein IAR50_006932 [Cryptococcus sp. DSM 104548]
MVISRRDFCKAWASYWDELDFVMQHVNYWEENGYLPRNYAPLPPRYALLITNPTIPPSCTWDLKGRQMRARLEAHYGHDAPFSASYVFYAKEVLELHEEGFEDRWFEMWERWKPDPVNYRLYRSPKDVPVSESELELKKKSEGVSFEEL